MKIERDQYWDVIKGLGIIAVVLGHAGIQGYFVSAYHLALFFFVSGFFYSDKHTSDMFAFFANKLKRLWWPTFLYTALFVLFHNVFVFFHFLGGVSTGNFLPGEYIDKNEVIRRLFLAFFGQHLEVLAGPLWFVFPLLISLVVFCLVRNLYVRLPVKVASYIQLLVIAALYLFGIFIIEQKIAIPFWTETAFLVMPVVYFGFISRNYIKKIIPNNVALLVFGVVVSAVVIQFFLDHKVIVVLTEKRYHDPLSFLAVTMVGIYMNLLIGELVCKVKKLAGLISYIGANSFHIMALHFLCFKVVNLFYIAKNNLSYTLMSQVVTTTKWWPLYVLAGVGLPVFLVYLYDAWKKQSFVEQKPRL